MEHEPTPTRYEALQLVAGHFENQEAMASAFGVTQATISRWLNQSKRLPTNYVLTAETLTGVSRHWLDPHCYPVEHGVPPRFHGVDRHAARVNFNNHEFLKGATG